MSEEHPLTNAPIRLFEREAETRQLALAWLQARAGHGSLWFVCAEGGGGKTRLLRGARSVREEGHALVLAAFRPGEGVPELAEATSELVAQGQANRMDLLPLSSGAIRAVGVRALQGEGQERALVAHQAP